MCTAAPIYVVVCMDFDAFVMISAWVVDVLIEAATAGTMGPTTAIDHIS